MSAVGSIDRGGPHYGVIPALFLIAPLLSCLVPRSAPGLLVLLGLVVIVTGLRQGLAWRALLTPSAALASCLAFTLYLFVNASWAWDPGNALGKAAFVLVAVLLVFAAANAFAHLDRWQKNGAALGFLIGVAIGALYLAVEMLTDGALRRAVMNSIPGFGPASTKHLTVVDGKVTQISPSEFNQNITLLMLSLWPAVFVLRSFGETARKRLVLAAAFLVLAFPAAISQHDSSQVALIASLLVFLVATYWPRSTVRGLALMWCLGFVLVLPASLLNYDAKLLHLVDQLPNSYQARIIIWEYTAERTLEQPWLGIGVNSTTRRDNDDANVPGDQPEGFIYQRTTAHHAHDIFLQTWYELGAVGAVLLALAGALVVLRIGLLPAGVQPFAAASFTAFVFIAAFAWGMWQTWFMAGIALVPLYVLMVAASAAVPMRESTKADPAAYPARATS